MNISGVIATLVATEIASIMKIQFQGYFVERFFKIGQAFIITGARCYKIDWLLNELNWKVIYEHFIHIYILIDYASINTYMTDLFQLIRMKQVPE